MQRRRSEGHLNKKHSQYNFVQIRPMTENNKKRKEKDRMRMNLS